MMPREVAVFEERPMRAHPQWWWLLSMASVSGGRGRGATVGAARLCDSASSRYLGLRSCSDADGPPALQSIKLDRTGAPDALGARGLRSSWFQMVLRSRRAYLSSSSPWLVFPSSLAPRPSPAQHGAHLCPVLIGAAHQLFDGMSTCSAL